MSEIIQQVLDAGQLADKLGAHPGLIPVRIDLDGGKLWWRDLGTYHPYEGFFKNTMAAFDSLQSLCRPGAPIEYFVTDIEVLLEDAIVRDPLPPSGFVFHMGRCGSTLLAKSLACSRSNLVFGEANPHQHIWAYLSGSGSGSGSASASASASLTVARTQRNLDLYRRLVLAMGRRRLDSHRWHFCKFTSFDTLFVDFILSAFPETPAIYLYRDPSEVLVSYWHKKAGWLAHRGTSWGDFMAGPNAIGQADELSYFADVIGNCLGTVLRCVAPNLRLLHYDALRVENLPAIWSWFGVDYPVEDRRRMQGQFGRYSKSDFVSVPFRPDREQKRQALTPEMVTLSETRLVPLYDRLMASPKNIVSTGTASVTVPDRVSPTIS